MGVISFLSFHRCLYRAVLHCVGWPLSPALKEVRKGKSSNSLARPVFLGCQLLFGRGEEGGKREMWSKSSLLSSWATDPSPSSFLVLFFWCQLQRTEEASAAARWYTTK